MSSSCKYLKLSSKSNKPCTKLAIWLEKLKQFDTKKTVKPDRCPLSETWRKKQDLISVECSDMKRSENEMLQQTGHLDY